MAFSDSSRDTSPDPIALPSSPLGRHSVSPAKTRRNMRATPSRSFVIEPLPSHNPNEESPWRVKVTVEASPAAARETGRRDMARKRLRDSPEKPRRAVRRSQSVEIRVEDDEFAAGGLKQPRRRRRGVREETPMLAPAAEEEEEAAPPPSTRASGRIAATARRQPSQVPNSARSHRSLQRMSPFIGDKTVTENEDFSMVSMESLQSAKEASMISVSRVSNKLNTIVEVSNSGLMETSVASVSYLPSSPPKRQTSARRSYSRQHAVNEASLSAVTYPDIEIQAIEAKETPLKTYDTMSWKPTGPARILQTESSIQNQSTGHHVSHAKVFEAEESPRELESRVEWRPKDSSKIQERRDERLESSVGKPTPRRRGDTVDIPSDDESSSESADSDQGLRENVDADDDGAAHAEEDDIWQEEASRSTQSMHDSSHSYSHSYSRKALQPETQQQQQEQQSANTISALFAHEQPRPRRAKIPRTWRRSSGADFSYVDSPAHGLLDRDDQHRDDLEPVVEAEVHHRKTGSGSEHGSRILTPPSTDDEHRHGNGQSDQVDDPSSELTMPDAEATRVQMPEADIEAGSEENSDDENIDEEDDRSPVAADETGIFFQQPSQTLSRGQQLLGAHLLRPAVRARPRPQRRSTANLTELLDLEAIPEKVLSPVREKPSEAIQNRRNLFGKSRSGLPAGETRPSVMPFRSEIEDTTHQDEAERRNDDILRRAKEICQRNEIRVRRVSQLRDLLHSSGDNQDFVETPAEEESVAMEFESSNHSVSLEKEIYRSYEEDLRLDSPQKVPVNFNDSSSMLRPSLPLEPRSHRGAPPLLDRPNAPLRPVSSNAEERPPTNVDDDSVARPGLFTRIWTTLIRPTGPSEIFPEQQPQYQSKIHVTNRQSQFFDHSRSTQDTILSISASLAEDDTTLEEVTFPISLRARLRARYGVLSNTHPWKLYHMRTLHRMYNSLTSGRQDTIVPRQGPLPPSLLSLVNTKQASINGSEFHFKQEYAQIVWSFYSLLVDQSIVVAMSVGEVDFLGDKLAKELRGVAKGDPLGRNGMECSVWSNELEQSEHGEITVEWIARALGDVVAEEEWKRRVRGS